MSALAWLRLALVPGLDAGTADRLLERFGDAAAVLAARAGDLRAAGLGEAQLRALATPPAERLAAAEAWLGQSAAHRLVAWRDPRYPHLLARIADPPLVLYVAGDPAALAAPQIAIVGSRQATPGGTATAREFAAHFAGCGLCVTSGLALGIDAAAHRGALDAGGQTIAVLGTGPDQVYPRQHAGLATEIVAHGALVSEFAPGMTPRREHFPQRNRIISGLAVGTLVVEAGIQSGALVTARLAAEQGREVFAIPGSIHNPVAKGCHKLIRSGAKLVETAGHVLEELPELLAAGAAHAAAPAPDADAPRPAGDDPDYATLLAALGWDPLDIDTLALRSGLTAAEVSSMLLILELQGRVRPLPGGRFQQQRN